MGFYCFVIVTAKSEHFKQMLDFWETQILPWNPLKSRIKKIYPWENAANRDDINRVALPKANGNQNKRDCRGRQSIWAPCFHGCLGEFVGCVYEEGERMEEEHHSLRRWSSRESGSDCVSISPCPCDIWQENIKKAEGNMLIIRGLFKKMLRIVTVTCFLWLQILFSLKLVAGPKIHESAS